MLAFDIVGREESGFSDVKKTEHLFPAHRGQELMEEIELEFDERCSPLDPIKQFIDAPLPTVFGEVSGKFVEDVDGFIEVLLTH